MFKQENTGDNRESIVFDKSSAKYISENIMLCMSALQNFEVKNG